MNNLSKIFKLYLLPSLLFLLLHTSQLTAASNSCPGSVISGSVLNAALIDDTNEDDYYRYTPGDYGQITLSFSATEKINIYVSKDACDDDGILSIGNGETSGYVTVNVTDTETLYIHAEYFHNDADYNITLNFEPALPVDICYDYAYKQNDVYLTEENDGSFDPRIQGTGLTNDNITVELYIQNIDPADTAMENLTVDIFDINVSQATYVPNSTWVTQPGELTPTNVTDVNSSASYNNDIAINDVISRDFFYLNYDLSPLGNEIDIPLNVRLNYTGNNIVIDSTIPLCNNNSLNYTPAYGIFNVEDSILTYLDKYNLPTQTANRVGDLVVAAYEADDVYQRKNVSTVVAVELIDAAKHGGIATSCAQYDSALTPRIWLTFDNNVSRTDFDYTTITDAIANGALSDQIPINGPFISTAPEFYSIARENAAFRITYNGAGSGDLLNTEAVTCPPQAGAGTCYNVKNFTEAIKYNGGNCAQDVDGNSKNIDKIPQFCNNAGTAAASAMTPGELATCMECIYGFDVNFLCSRDNFAIRPESYRMTLNDQNQNDPTQQSLIAINDNLAGNQNRNHTNNTPYHVAAGYNYALQIRAANHVDDNATPGYNVGFFMDGNDSQRSFRLAWPASVNPSSTYCNDTADHNKTVTLLNGGADLNLSSDQVGKYNLTMFDRLWTRVDWDPTLMTHHTTGQGAGYFLTGRDCVWGTSAVPSQNTLTGFSGENLTNVSGCDISSDNHTNINNNLEYKDIALRVHPYKFDLNGSNPINPNVGPYTRTNGQTFVYIDTPPTMDENNTDMSYNMNGTFFAAGYNDIGSLSNFVTGCYADDLNMALSFTYNSPEPSSSKTPFLSYSLKDHNTTDKTDIYRPVPVSGYLLDDHFEVGDHNSSTVPLIIDQNGTFFVKPMLGAITMDLGYNFKRDYNNTLNPRYIEFHDFNITYKTNPTNIKADLQSDHQIFGDIILDHDVTFVYGRAKPSQYFYDDVTANFVDTPISIVIYCDQDPVTCSAVYNITNTTFGQTDEYNWYLSLGHVTNENDGNITLNASTGGSVSPTDPAAVAINDSGGVNDPDVRVSATATIRPLNVDITFGADTNRWLVYNKDKNETPIPFYRVRFIGQSGWAGYGDTGHVVDTDASTKKNRRLGW
ncbi:hypothetical protein [Sulfurovum sp. AR]|uniref:hypothetical protein n=1 Tax=Sulfurovum sp. AR TaxID=1165841 RepID=UPI00025C4B2E|nr:hypothetical protein [Sulfurovum sp. AR]EIF50965.1 hypothetical protein SULAR_06338 [Sulfurovum sp. AR]